MDDIDTVLYAKAIPNVITSRSSKPEIEAYNKAVFEEVGNQLRHYASATGQESIKQLREMCRYVQELDAINETSNRLFPKNEKERQNFVGFCSYILNVLLKFTEWALEVPADATDASKKVRADTDTIVKLWETFSKDPNMGKQYLGKYKVQGFADTMKETKKNLTKESLRMLEGLVPIDRIEHFKQLRELDTEDRAAFAEYEEGLRIKEREKERTERDMKTIVRNYRALMDMFPDPQSQAEIKRYINQQLAERELKYNFNDKVSGGSPDKTDMKFIRGMLQSTNTVKRLMNMFGSEPNDSRVNENMKATILALIMAHKQQPTATDQAPTDALDEQTLETMKTAILGMIKEGKVDTKVNLDMTDDRIVELIRSALLSLIMHTNTKEHAPMPRDDVNMQEIVLNSLKTGILAAILAKTNIQQASVALTTTAPSHEDVIMRSAILAVIQSFRMDERVKKLEDKLEQTASSPPTGVDPLTHQIAMASILSILSQQNKNTDSARSDTAEIDRKISGALNILKGTIFNDIQQTFATSESVKNTISSLEQKYALPSLSNLATKEDLSTINKKYEDVVAKVGETVTQLTTLINSRKGGMAGGADVAQDAVAQAKQIRKDLDDVKKTLRGITDAFGGLEGKYNKFHKTLPSQEDRTNFQNGKYGDSKRVLGMYSYLNEEGRKFMDELKSTVAEKKKALVTAQEAIQKVYDTEPTNPVYIKDANTLKTTVEGDYNSNDNLGVLSLMDKIAGTIQGEYDENFSVLKAAAEGIKQEKEYAIREKQQQIAPLPYGVPASNNDAVLKQQAIAKIKEVKNTIDAYMPNIDEMIKKLNIKLQAQQSQDVNTNLTQTLSTAKENQDKLNKIVESVKTYLEAAEKDTGSGAATSNAQLAVQAGQEAKQLFDFVQSLQNDGSAPKAPNQMQSNDSISKLFDDVKTKVGTNILKELVQKLDQIYLRKVNPALSGTATGEPSMLTLLWDNYLKEKDTNGAMVASKKLTEQLEANNLIPKDVLKISTIDKSIFIFFTLVVRMVSISISSYLITKGKLKTLPWALGAFLFLYALIYVAFVMFVNLDMYRLRIIFNYINLHGNTGNIFMHLLLMWLFSFVIFLVMWNINFPIRGIKTTAISDEEKSELIYRLEILTMIVWLFLVLMVLVMR